MANLGNIGGALFYFGVESARNTWQGQGGITNYHSDMTATTAFPNKVAILFTNVTYVAKADINSSGVFHFYDYDDTRQFPYVIYITDPLTGALGEIWKATITAGVVTITQVFSSQRGGSYAFT